ncbi:ubiquitin carboxyl-terminal hydrolase [Phanerochaete sordida]|uniref:Ubiquitin carboxyl-terminal hydrolase n=1 Tax=Phanerochaete sordida TaxID=48140 RepID=A0A9P3GB10_9APHY|nr:ubiquitin carboxyl-terminal hydrolase [Phanerochaete sordida]
MASRWLPLESNPDVMNAWSSKAGLVTSQDQFTDVYGFDPDLLAMVPQPVKAVVLLFPISKEYEARRTAEDESIARAGQHPVDPTVIWIKQTIQNACGTMGLLHALLNSNVTLEPESALEKFIDLCKGKTPEERAKLLETTPLFANIHAEAAAGGQTAAPDISEDVDLHFTCFVRAPDPAGHAEGVAAPEGAHRLLELDGRRAGPIDRGVSEDLLRDAAAYIKENYVKDSTSVNFSMLALAPPADF